MAIYALGDRVPQVDPTAFVHPEATLIGAVRIGPGSSVWPGAVLRGDSGQILIGSGTSVQDGSVLHATANHDTVVGDRCTIGHMVHLEGCTIHDDALIGSGSILLHRVVVESWALVGAGALLPNDFHLPSRALAIGVPAKVREGAVNPDLITDSAAIYQENAKRYLADLRRLD